MTFPAVPRVVYGKNPLDQVICQLRFPTILRIDSEIPSAFQEAIREKLPEYSETTETTTVEVSPKAQGAVPPELLGKVIQTTTTKNHVFTSEDDSWRVNLTRGFLALTAKKYERWEIFKEWLAGPIQALKDHYAPPYFSRIGLRYVDLIQRSRLGLESIPWRDLLIPQIAGLMGSPDEIVNAVQSLQATHELSLDDYQGKLKLATGLASPKDSDEVCFAIDADFFTTERVTTGNEAGVLDYFNKRASRLIRWSIKDRLHDAMEPEVI